MKATTYTFNEVMNMKGTKRVTDMFIYVRLGNTTNIFSLISENKYINSDCKTKYANY